MTNQYKTKLSGLIDNSGLDADQKKLWGVFIKEATPDEDEAVYEALSESDENLNVLTKFLRDKIREMKERNSQAWTVIMNS